MTQTSDVLFYVLPSKEAEAREHFIAKLVNKIYQEARQCDIRMDTSDAMQRLDTRLWDFKPHSFIPHAVEQEMPAPIQLWVADIPQPGSDVLLNIHPSFPDNFTRYQRTIEVLDQSEALIQRGRERWKQYKSQGFDPVVHQL